MSGIAYPQFWYMITLKHFLFVSVLSYPIPRKLTTRKFCLKMAISKILTSPHVASEFRYKKLNNFIVIDFSPLVLMVCC